MAMATAPPHRALLQKRVWRLRRERHRNTALASVLEATLRRKKLATPKRKRAGLNDPEGNPLAEQQALDALESRSNLVHAAPDGREGKLEEASATSSWSSELRKRDREGHRHPTNGVAAHDVRRSKLPAPGHRVLVSFRVAQD